MNERLTSFAASLAASSSALARATAHSSSELASSLANSSVAFAQRLKSSLQQSSSTISSSAFSSSSPRQSAHDFYTIGVHITLTSVKVLLLHSSSQSHNTADAAATASSAASSSFSLSQTRRDGGDQSITRAMGGVAEQSQAAATTDIEIMARSEPREIRQREANDVLSMREEKENVDDDDDEEEQEEDRLPLDLQRLRYAAQRNSSAMSAMNHTVLAVIELEHGATLFPSSIPVYSSDASSDVTSSSSSLASSSPTSSRSIRVMTSAPSIDNSVDDLQLQEQDIEAMLATFKRCCQQLPSRFKQLVEFIGFSSDIPSVVLWNDRQLKTYIPKIMSQKRHQHSSHDNASTQARQVAHSNLLSWSRRNINNSSQTTQSVLPSPTSVESVMTLAKLATHSSCLPRYTRAASIADFFLWILLNCRDTDNSSVILYPCYMHASNALRFGAFDADRRQWQSDRISAAQIPSTLIPIILDDQCPPLFPCSSLMLLQFELGHKSQCSVAIHDELSALLARHARPRTQHLKWKDCCAFGAALSGLDRLSSNRAKEIKATNAASIF